MKALVLLWLSLGFLISAIGGERLGYHELRTDVTDKLVPWCSPDRSEAYNRVVGLVWQFWQGLGNCSNGVPYFFQHQVWSPEHDPRGLGGDQLAMALSSLNLLYGYSGDPAVRQMMVRIADYYIAHGFSGPHLAWPNLPYPYNTEVHSGRYDGDMRAGEGFLQPDKAGSFGAELVTLYEMTGDRHYLHAAVGIANTLASKVVPGDEDHSPWPFRVHAKTGETSTKAYGTYTANWTGALRLFSELRRLKRGNIASYGRAMQIANDWLRSYPLQNNKWGPFFEDITPWSNTEINADTMAWYLLENPQWDIHSTKLARGILDWTLATFGTNRWEQLGVTAIQEQTAYRVPGNSHTSRHASVELIYCEKTGDNRFKEAALRQLDWATYMVDVDGKNRYPNNDIWLTDGYGDYLRHYLRAMAAMPELAPADQPHLLRSSSVIRQIEYRPGEIRYRTFDARSRERLRVPFQSVTVQVGGKRLRRLSRLDDLERSAGYFLETAGPSRGWLELYHSNSGSVVIRGAP